ncbi:MAG TPA: metallophosphoesterase [Bryobacteraceae bacterium]|jgi:3',5'-cyclic AMP phosphodiesterase CpdA|nr:metallophosphoesterase [Bryobacteraceae bacterium]
MRRSGFCLFLAGLLSGQFLPALEIELPQKADSIRFAVIGDSGTGEKAQYDVARTMEECRRVFPFTFVLMLGDNIYGSDTAADFKAKFEAPYKPLLDAGVKFYASLGNHDNPNQRFYKPFNMGERRYYNFKFGNAEFFALDSTYMDPAQLDWIRQQLRDSKADWKICYFHHPLYTEAKFHGPDKDLRARLEPIFRQYGVRVVLSGHEHVYERIKPQNGIDYFVLGSSGQLRYKNLRKHSTATAKGFDTEQTFMIIQIAADELDFQTLSKTGVTVDHGTFTRAVLRR